jgi:hypothetical protein
MKRLIISAAVLGILLLLQGCAYYARPYGYGYYGSRYYGYAPYYGYSFGYWPYYYNYPYPYYYYRYKPYYGYRPSRPPWEGSTWGGRYGGRKGFSDRSGGLGGRRSGSVTPRSITPRSITPRSGGPAGGGGRPGLGGRGGRR